MIGAVVWNIGLLLFFKYTDFFIGAANSIFGTQIKALGLALPIGISFYSFQTLSYVIDVYKGEVRSQKNFLDLATYVALFPQLIAGPIVRYIDVAEQLKKRNESIEHFAQGVWRFSIGLGKKVILANTIGELFDTISNSAQSELSVAASWLGIIAYTFQIYFDFSGYSDMAIGLGKMFGFDFSRTSTTLTSPPLSQTSGDAGICHFQAGSEIMSISHLAVTARAKQDSALTS